MPEKPDLQGMRQSWREALGPDEVVSQGEDGVALYATAMPEGLAEELAEAILSGKLGYYVAPRSRQFRIGKLTVVFVWRSRGK